LQLGLQIVKGVRPHIVSSLGDLLLMGYLEKRWNFVEKKIFRDILFVKKKKKRKIQNIYIVSIANYKQEIT
jgi:hypothetical protein